MKPDKPKELMRDDCAVYIRHAWKSYKKPYYLFTDLELSMGKGTIYALLGASGCGKTTLLSCIVGIRRLDSGEIWVLGGKPGTKGSGVPGNRVGYMPQELALYGDFSIKETMLYFGWIFGLKTKSIIETIHFLVQLLDLPPPTRLVRSLSGGQQRRVSLAVAVMHEPELLILDEPTVGVDPILRANIWNYMLHEVKERKTSIIITTHYIEEARQAHMIGLMRDGHLLAENSPSQLLTTYGCANLEDVFLKLARQQTASGQDEAKTTLAKKEVEKGANKKERPATAEGTRSSEGNQRSNSHGCCQNFYYNLKHFSSCVRLRALLFKNLLRLIRNIQVLLVIFALPVVQVVLFCLCIGNEPRDLTVGIANDEVDFVSRTRIDCPHRLECSIINNTPHINEAENLSCRYMEYLNIDTVHLEYYPDMESCRQAVEDGNAWSCIHFKKDFTRALAFQMKQAWGQRNLTEIIGEAVAGEITLEDSDIQVWLDQSDYQIAYVLQRDLNEGFRNFTVDMLEDCYVHPDIVKPIVSFQTPPVYGTDRPSFTDFAAPGFLLTIVFFLAVALTSSVLIIERQEGLLDRSYVAGVNPGEILFSHVITQFIIMVGQTILALVFMLAVFKVKCIGNLVLVVMMTLLQGLCGMCFGFVISAICSLERDAIQMALGSFYPTLMLSGVIWPIEAMSTGLMYIALFLPLTLTTAAMRSIMLRGWGFAWSDVYCGFIATFLWIVIFLVMTLLILKLKKS